MDSTTTRGSVGKKNNKLTQICTITNCKFAFVLTKVSQYNIIREQQNILVK